MAMCSVVIVAGGKGKRLKSNISKQFLEIKNIPIISYTINKFHKMEFVEEIIVVIPEEFEKFFQEEIKEKYEFDKVKYVFGGAERGDSVYKGLLAVGDYETVLIHDGVRPFIHEDIIRKIAKETKEKNAVIPVVQVKDTIKVCEDGMIIQTLEREKLFNVQTPQGFNKKLILDTYKKNIDNISDFTDDASLLEKENIPVYTVLGDYLNIKITTEDDLLHATQILKNIDNSFIPKEKLLTVSKNNTGDIENVTIYTDGGSSGNPGPGGYGVVMLYKGVEKELSQGFELTTNNRMELLAVIVGLEQLKMSCNVNVYSDSRYVVDAIEKGWAKKWQQNGWIRSKNKMAANIDLWKRALDILATHNVTMNWVKGHSGDKYNERCDVLAKEAMFSNDLLTDDGYEE